MKITKCLYLSAFLSIFLIAGCAPDMMSFSAMSYFDKGATEEAFQEYMEPDYTFRLQAMPGNSEITVNAYKIWLYHDNYNIAFISLGKKIYSHVIFAFDSGKLIYWGYPEEFSRSDDELIRRIGEQSSKFLYSELEDE